MVPDLQSGKHGSGRNLKGLDNKSADEKGEKQGNEDCFDIFSNNGFFFHRSNLGRRRDKGGAFFAENLLLQKGGENKS